MLHVYRYRILLKGDLNDKGLTWNAMMKEWIEMPSLTGMIYMMEGLRGSAASGLHPEGAVQQAGGAGCGHEG